MALSVMACTVETAQPVAQEPRCEPRRTTDPARLTLLSSAEQHGAIAPCHGTIEFAIPRHTELRRVEGVIVTRSGDGEQPRSQPFVLDLSGPAGGMYRGPLAFGPVDDQACRAVVAEVIVEACTGDGGERIECPAVRVRESYVLERLDAAGPGVEVCYDE